MKNLSFKLAKRGGRNNFGHLTSYHRGGGHSRRYRIIDFNRYFSNIPAFVRRVEYDPNRNALLALLVYSNGYITYCLLPKTTQVGSILINYDSTSLLSGNALLLSQIPIGFYVHAVELQPGEGATIVRSGGVKAQILARVGHTAILKLPSGEIRRFSVNCKAVIGSVASLPSFYLPDRKAGKSRWLNWRPHVRGVAMNPIDHPHGGGEGRSSGGRKASVSPWGVYTKGLPTRKRSKNLSRIMLTRRAAKVKTVGE